MRWGSLQISVWRTILHDEYGEALPYMPVFYNKKWENNNGWALEFMTYVEVDQKGEYGMKSSAWTKIEV